MSPLNKQAVDPGRKAALFAGLQEGTNTAGATGGLPHLKLSARRGGGEGKEGGALGLISLHRCPWSCGILSPVRRGAVCVLRERTCLHCRAALCGVD